MSPLPEPPMPFVSRAGDKLEHALATFGIDITGKLCADLGCNVGGFTDCMLRRGAARVYAVDTGYGVLDYRLRKDPRVVVLERTNALHLSLPEKVDFITIDVAWTRQKLILPAAARHLTPTGQIVTLIKPHYEAPKNYLKAGILDQTKLDEVLESVKKDIATTGLQFLALTPSPIKGTGGNTEALAWLQQPPPP